MKQRQRQSQDQRQPNRRKSSHASLETALNLWNEDSRAQGFSERYVYTRTSILKNFFWWLSNAEGAELTAESLTPSTIRGFLAYLREPAPDGRFGSSHPNAKKQVRPATLNRNYRDVKTFISFMDAEGLLTSDPLQNVKAPKVPKDQVQPLSNEEVGALVNATAHTSFPERNKAIVLFLLDTGLRLSELCSLKVGDLQASCVSVVGKGNKRRVVYFGTATRRNLNTYLTRFRKDANDDEPLWISAGGTTSGEAFTATGVYQLIRQLGMVASITGKRVSPHVLRHTFCVNFLRNGGNLFTLQQLMGHADLTILRRYVCLAEADLQSAHRLASPADRMKLR